MSVGKRKAVLRVLAKSCVSGLLWRKKRLAVGLVFLKNGVSELFVRVAIASKSVSCQSSVQKYSNVEVTGDPLEAARDAGMFVI